MNILVVCHYGLYQDLSFSFVHNQVREYAALGHRVRVIIPNGIGKIGRNGRRFGRSLVISNCDGVEMYDLRYVTLSRYGEKKFNVASAIAAIQLQWKRIFENFQPDVIHAHTLGFDSEIGAWIKEKFQCPLVVTTHGGDTFIPYYSGKQEELKKYADMADTVVCVSSLLRRKLVKCGVNTKLDVILNGFISSNVYPAEGKKALSIIQVGSLIPRKKADVTIRAVAALKAENYSVHLTIVGFGPEYESLRRLCDDLGVTSYVTFTGQIPNLEVHRLMAESSFFVMPSVREGFGIVYLEAMAAGCVTIGTRGEGIADLIDNGENGFLVPEDDPQAIAQVIANCIQNFESAKVLSERGRQTVARLTWKNNVEKYMNLFKELLQC